MSASAWTPGNAVHTPRTLRNAQCATRTPGPDAHAAHTARRSKIKGTRRAGRRTHEKRGTRTRTLTICAGVRASSRHAHARTRTSRDADGRTARKPGTPPQPRPAGAFRGAVGVQHLNSRPHARAGRRDVAHAHAPLRYARACGRRAVVHARAPLTICAGVRGCPGPGRPPPAGTCQPAPVRTDRSALDVQKLNSRRRGRDRRGRDG